MKICYLNHLLIILYSRGKKEDTEEDTNKKHVPYKLSFGCMHLRCCRAYEYKIGQGNGQ